MKTRIFLPAVILFHIGWVFLHIYQHNEYVKHSFAAQKAEHTHTLLAKKKNECEQTKCLIANLTTVKEHAESKLNMRPISISQIKRKSDDQPRT